MRNLRWRFLAALSIVALLLASCRDTGGDGKYFELDGKLFVFNYRVATASYLVNIKPLGPVEEGWKAITRFEDPAGGAAIVVEKKIWPKLPRTTIESPPLRCVVKDRPYAVSIRIEGSDGTPMQTIETTMMSSETQAEVLPDQPLVVGPGYQANPALAGHPDGKVPGGTGPCP